MKKMVAMPTTPIRGKSSDGASLVFLANGFPDRLSADPESPFFCRVSLQKKPRVMFNGVEQPGNVTEYCVSEGWIKRTTNASRNATRRGRALAFKVRGVVEVLSKA